MPSNEVANANYPSQSSNESSLDASLSTTDVLNLDKAIQRQVDLDNGRTDVDISTNTDSDRILEVHDAILNRKLDSNNQSLESQSLQQFSSIDNRETVINNVKSQTGNTLQNHLWIGDNHSQDIQTSKGSNPRNIDINNQTLANDISAENNLQAIQTKPDISNPEQDLDNSLDSNTYTNSKKGYDNNISIIFNNNLAQKLPSNPEINSEESFPITTNILDSHSVDLQTSSQENIQKVSEDPDLSNALSKSMDISNQKIETVDTSTSLNTIQKDEIDTDSQLIQRKPESIKSESIKPESIKSESIKSESTPLENLEGMVQAKTANAIASSNDQSDPTVIQRLSDHENVDDLVLPTVLQNLGQTESLSNFTPLNNNQFNSQDIAKSTSTHPSQLLQAKSNSSTFSNSENKSESSSNIINALSPTPTKIQAKADSTNQRLNSSPQETHAGWSNIAELLANMPPPQVSNSPSTSSLNSLNKKSVGSSDRSSLASNPKPSPPASSQTTSSQTVIQRSLDDSTDDEDLYITPTGLQRGNPNQLANSQSNIIQRKRSPSVDASNPEATVTVTPSDESNNKANFDENLNALAQEIYVLLRQRLEIEKERQGSRYQGRLPW
jgi:hypothetical protein